MAETPPPIVPPTVVAPDATLRLGPNEKSIWDAHGRVHDMAAELIGPQMAMSVLLSRGSREARRLLGVHGAKAVFEQMAATMEAAADGDR